MKSIELTDETVAMLDAAITTHEAAYGVRWSYSDAIGRVFREMLHRLSPPERDKAAAYGIAVGVAPADMDALLRPRRAGDA